jgi:hypothetical protein
MTVYWLLGQGGQAAKLSHIDDFYEFITTDCWQVAQRINWGAFLLEYCEERVILHRNPVSAKRM